MIRVLDSTDAAEQRELERDRAVALAEQATQHRRRCRGGILGEDVVGRPVPCPLCRPDLFVSRCPTCTTSRTDCSGRHQRSARRCCDSCSHAPAPSLTRVLLQVTGVTQ